MTTYAAAPSSFQGAAQILRFNWPFYAVGSATVGFTGAVAFSQPLPSSVRMILIVGVSLAAFWLVASLTASYFAYDRSPLRQWKWVVSSLEILPRRWINLHAGLDESTLALLNLLPASSGRAFDLFDPAEMTERSIHRARAHVRNAVVAERVDYHRLPVADGACDAAFLLLSAHELRRPESRVTLFRELRRTLASHGHIVLAEHLRDAANFVAFGPGFLHFHSRGTWLRDAAAGRFIVEREFRITPFVAVFILRRLA